MLRTGVIADDFTGATDIASAYVRRGYRAVVITDVREGEPTDADVVVIALKSRTAPVDDAVRDALSALEALTAGGCERFVFKYCSTFDSTDRGNIGPVLDALAERLQTDRVVVVPSFPDNGRTVYQGHLFVGADLLEHSSMRHHPLTPMTRSRVADILRPQTRYPVAEVHLDAVRGADLNAAIDDAPGRSIVVDAIDDTDLTRIAAATADDVLISGAAGLALGAPLGSADPGDVVRGIAGRRLVVCGSASSRTREQVARAIAAGVPARRLLPGEPVGTVIEWLADQYDRSDDAATDSPARIPVVYTVGDLADVDPAADASALEHTLAEIVRTAIERLGVRSVIVGGGETSGAVVGGLGVRRLDIGPAIAPGVCWSAATTASGHRIALALKSGNFGAPDMFTTAWGILR